MTQRPNLPYRPACSKELADMVYENLVSLGDKAAIISFYWNSHGVLITTNDLHPRNHRVGCVDRL